MWLAWLYDTMQLYDRAIYVVGLPCKLISVILGSFMTETLHVMGLPSELICDTW